jgi:hypothetical protein
LSVNNYFGFKPKSVRTKEYGFDVMNRAYDITFMQNLENLFGIPRYIFLINLRKADHNSIRWMDRPAQKVFMVLPYKKHGYNA